MGKVTITLDVYDENSDPDDSTGVSEETFDRFSGFLTQYGDDFNIERAD